MDHTRAGFFGFDHPLEPDGVRLSHVRANDQHAVAVRQILQKRRAAATSEGRAEARNRSAVTDPALVLDLRDAKDAEQFGQQIALFVIEG